MNNTHENHADDRIVAAMLTGKARIVAMIGSPIAHAKSPAIFNRWFADHNMAALMTPMDIPADDLGAFFRFLRGWTNCNGAVVTAPHKQACLELVDSATQRAALLQAVNVVTRNADGSLIGDNVDGDGFVRAMQSKGHDPASGPALIFGCGGAGAAIALALSNAKARRLQLYDTDNNRMRRLASLLADNTGASISCGEPDALESYDLIVNATTVGLLDDAQICPLETISPGAVIADIVSSGSLTAWLRAARARGNPVMTGEDMAQGQFALLASRTGFDMQL
ncbi:hypothetical protein K1W69_06675 [Hoeflea sp. WL0058]|uniref:Shikimate dehydrogenase substrate binding N-terminal domain-containing protein n=1 Tax=Flavimaribacter sediminis TaxID=2865987 RepID=A0AAE2ZIJ1_9HYPH|nr:hypothetical protein [Flavimaribacter sediminis]MBW8636866.1 hypothetical protein [Flavimaribacter sediminis]